MTIIVAGTVRSRVKELKRELDDFLPMADVEFRQLRTWQAVKDLVNLGTAQHYIIVSTNRFPLVRSDLKDTVDAFVMRRDGIVMWPSLEEFSYPDEVYTDSQPFFAKFIQALRLAKQHRSYGAQISKGR